jgi:predicted AAA+ superfamily ATPase
METLFEQSESILEETSLSFTRGLLDTIDWSNRLIGLKGARGTGKTTLLLQWLKLQNLPSSKGAYFSMDDLYFSAHTLKETARHFYKNGGKILVLDEVHKYKNWSAEIKNIYDFYPGLKVIFTGSSIIDLSKQQGDLSRRAVMYELPGLSFREYLSMKEIIRLEKIPFSRLISDDASKLKTELPKEFRPYEFFKDYLEKGYYPILLEGETSVHQKINQMIRTIVESDMAELKDFDIRNAKKMLQLVYIIAQQVPFKPNITSLAEKTGIHRNTISNYLYFLEQARLINLLQPKGTSISTLKRPEKIYLNNTTLQYSLGEEKANKGSVRETFFYSQLFLHHKVQAAEKGDFTVNNKYIFEVGGESKNKRQIAGLKNAFIVNDDLEYPQGKNIPLWMFGMDY